MLLDFTSIFFFKVIDQSPHTRKYLIQKCLPYCVRIMKSYVSHQPLTMFQTKRSLTDWLRHQIASARKVFKYGVSSGPYFPVFGLNTGKYGPGKTLYLRTFHTVCYIIDLFFIWIFFHEHSLFTGQQGKGEGICLTRLYHFHPLHRHLDISRAITADISPLHIASTRTRTGNLCVMVHNTN